MVATVMRIEGAGEFYTRSDSTIGAAPARTGMGLADQQKNFVDDEVARGPKRVTAQEPPSLILRTELGSIVNVIV